MQLGDYRVEIVPDARFRLDGGAMFGVVPRTLWQRVAPPDDRNRIELGANCLFIETARERILVETGMGDKWSPKLADIYHVRRERPLAESVRATTGYGPEQITIVVNTHLHFDHAAGNTVRTTHDAVVPAFPNARYFVAREEFEHANAPSERDQASYMPEDWRPLEQTGQLELKDAEYEVVPGVVMKTVPGHSRTMQTVRVDAGGRTLYGFADLVPTRAHLPLPWIMGYDLYPLETLAAKKRLLPQAVRDNWICLFYHDPDEPINRLIEDEGRLRAVKL